MTIEGTIPMSPPEVAVSRRRLAAPAALLAAVLLGTLPAGCSMVVEKRAGWTPILPPPGGTSTAATAANGLDRLDAGDVYGRIHQAFDESPSVHATGELAAQDDTVLLDVHLEAGGAQGTFVSSSLGRVTQIVVGQAVYLSGDQAFLRSLGGEALAARGRDGAWISGTRRSPGLVALPLLSKAEYLALLSSSRLYSLGDDFTAGVRTRTFTNDDGLRMEVPLAGEPRLMRAWKHDRDGHLDLHFEYGPRWAVQAPGTAGVV